MKSDRMLRIRISTWRRLRHTFPGVKGETMGEYIDRLSKAVEEMDVRRYDY